MRFLHNFIDNTYYLVCIMLNILKNNEINGYFTLDNLSQSPFFFDIEELNDKTLNAKFTLIISVLLTSSMRGNPVANSNLFSICILLNVKIK